MIPEALKWNESKKKYAGLKLFRFFNLWKSRENYNYKDYLKSMHEPLLNKKLQDVSTISELYVLTSRLQKFFNCSVSGVFIDNQAYNELFQALYEVMTKTDLDDFSYFHGNLTYLKANSMSELLQAINNHRLEEGEWCDSGFLIDCVLRNIEVCIRDGKSYLNDVEIQAVSKKLKPLLKLMEEKNIRERQINRLAN